LLAVEVVPPKQEMVDLVVETHLAAQEQVLSLHTLDKVEHNLVVALVEVDLLVLMQVVLGLHILDLVVLLEELVLGRVIGEAAVVLGIMAAVAVVEDFLIMQIANLVVAAAVLVLFPVLGQILLLKMDKLERVEVDLPQIQEIQIMFLDMAAAVRTD
jgi:hypothetical protein